MNSPAPLRIALFGSGRIGQVHAHNIAAHPDFELAYIADPFPAGAEALAAATGGTAKVVTSADEVFADDTLDAVLIGSPTNTHCDLIQAAVKHGVAALCEKPIDLDIARVRECEAAIAGSESIVMLGFNRRFDPSFAAIQRRVAAGEIGTLEQLSIISRDPAPAPAEYIRVSGGIFRDMSIHDLDMARFFVPNIVEVFATGSNLFSDYIKAENDYDSVIIVLKGANGEQITITNSRHASYGYDQRLEAFGSNGMLEAGNLTPTSVRKHSAEFTGQADPIMDFFLERYAAAYRAELDHFTAAIRTTSVASPSFADGAQALALADACLESARTGRVVAL